MGDHPRPTTFHSLWGGRIEVRCYGRETGNWAFPGTSPEKAEADNPGIMAKLSLVAGRGMVMLAPHATRFNAVITAPDSLTSRWRPWLHRGVDADGTLLERKGRAFAIASGDCPTLVLHDLKSGLTVATHSGRNCLFDSRAVIEDGPSRRDASVVDAAVRALKDRGAETEDLRAFIACGIGPTKFFHRMYAEGTWPEKNARMNAYFLQKWGPLCFLGDPSEGRLALSEIIRGQLADHGVHPAHVAYDGVDTYTDVRRPGGGPRWHSHRRDGGGARNLVLVLRR